MVPSGEMRENLLSGTQGYKYTIQRRRVAMTNSEEILPEKTSLDRAVDIVAGLKEMIHYAKTNIEKLSEYWLFMEDEAKRKDLAEMLDDLLDKQSSLHNDLEETTSGIEMEINKIKNEGGESL
jgi:hypothetical protein